MMTEKMYRDDVLWAATKVASRMGAVIFVGNGNNARALYAIDDRPEIFYMVGSMGLCAALAAGFSHCAQVPTMVIEGDGNTLMGLSGLPAVTKAAKEKFVHLVLDNGIYETTGGQKTLASMVSFKEIAIATGYECVHQPKNLEELEAMIAIALTAHYRTFLYIATRPQAGVQHPRVGHHPHDIATRFMEAVNGND
jgi:phosphonopyruvate decarboxylase